MKPPVDCMKDKLRIALVVSHPIGNFCPQYASFAENKAIDLKVFFGSMLGYKKYIDPYFKKEVSWGNLYLDQFPHEFLNGDAVLMPEKNLDAPSLDAALNDFAPDLVIVYGYFQQLQKRASTWAKKNARPIAYISDTEMRQKRSWVKEILKYPFLRNYFSSIRFFLTVGDANEAFYKKHGVNASQLLRMHFPIDVKHYRKEFGNHQVLRQQTRNKYHVTEEDIVLSVVGKLVAWKNQDHLIDALQVLEEKNIVLQLFIIGSGEMQRNWEEKALDLKKSKVHFTGFVPIDQLPAYYAATDIYVHPASVEPHSIAISEAIYMGCPVITSNTSGSYGASDDVQEGKNGFVYPFGDIKSLCVCIEKLVADKKLRSAFSAYSHHLGMAFQQQAHAGIIDDLVKRVPLAANKKNDK